LHLILIEIYGETARYFAALNKLQRLFSIENYIAKKKQLIHNSQQKNTFRISSEYVRRFTVRDPETSRIWGTKVDKVAETFL
jgi:hypothetical protein